MYTLCINYCYTSVQLMSVTLIHAMLMRLVPTTLTLSTAPAMLDTQEMDLSAKVQSS